MQEAMLLTDLPDDVFDVIAHFMKTDGIWRDIRDVVHDYCTLAMTSKSLSPLAERLATYISRETDMPRPPPRVVAPRTSTLTMKHTVADMKAELKSWALPHTGRKQELFDRIQAEVVLTANPIDPVPSNPIPKDKQWQYRGPRRITQSTAKKDYRLKDDDLEQLECMLHRNPYGRRSPPMKLYYVSDVRIAAMMRFGSRMAFETTLARAQNRQHKARMTKAERSAERERILVAELRKHGCELREDSRLCSAYIQRGVGDPQEIATTMEEMQFFHNHTQYQQIISRNIEDALDNYGHFDRDEESYCAKALALQLYVRAGMSLHLIPESLRNPPH